MSRLVSAKIHIFRKITTEIAASMATGIAHKCPLGKYCPTGPFRIAKDKKTSDFGVLFLNMPY